MRGYGKVQITQMLRGLISSSLAGKDGTIEIFYYCKYLLREAYPHVQGSYIFFDKQSEIGMTVFKILPATDGNLDKVKHLIATTEENSPRVEMELKSIHIDKFLFALHNLNSVATMKYLTEQSKELDPKHIGITFITLNPSPPYKGGYDIGEGFFGLSLRQLVDYICTVAKLHYRIEGNTVVFFGQ
jgi:hypothetical protein